MVQTSRKADISYSRERNCPADVRTSIRFGRVKELCLGAVRYIFNMMDLRKQNCVRKCSRKFQSGRKDIRVYYSSVRHSTSETVVDVVRVTGLILEIRRFKIRGLLRGM